MGSKGSENLPVCLLTAKSGLVENFFAKLKEFRAIATRYDKTDESFSANIYLVAAIIAAR